MDNQDKKVVGYVVTGIFLFILIVIGFMSIGTVDSGDRGVKTRFGKVVGVIDPGLYFKAPLIESVHEMDVQTQKEQTDAQAASSDLQDVKTTVAVNYRLNAEKIGDLYTNIGIDYKGRVIDPAIQEVVKAVTAKYSAEQLITKRPEVTDAIKAQLSEKMALYDISVDTVSIVNFDFSTSFSQAIEAKVTAEQNALAAKNKVEQANYEAQAIKIKSEAANNEKYIQLQTLEVQRAAVEKWDGHLPTQMIPGSSLPFINIGK